MTTPDDGAPRGRRVWIVNHYADAPDRASGTRHFDLARRLVARGHDVTIFASGFSHVTGREERLRDGRLYRRESFEGVRFIWLRTSPYRGNGGRRQLNMLSFLLVFLIVQVKVLRPDAVIGSTVHPFAALGAWMVARARRATFLFEIRDLWPQTLVDMGAMRVGSIGERTLRRIEAFLVRRATVVIALLPGIQGYLRERGLPANHVLYVPNGVDLEAFDVAVGDPTHSVEAAPYEAIAVAHRREGRVVFGYVGAFGRVNDVATVIQGAVAAEEREPGLVALILVGDGPERALLESMAAGLDHVTLAAPVPKRTVPKVLRALDVGVVHATATPVYRYGISFNKLFEYFAARVPVLFACTSAYDPVASSGAGVTIAPGDPAAVADGFLRLAHVGASERSRMGEAGRAYVAREHDIECLAAMLAGPEGLDLDQALTGKDA
jgi:glycosyltransferase involved in cell wall biosynthesis